MYLITYPKKCKTKLSRTTWRNWSIHKWWEILVLLSVVDRSSSQKNQQRQKKKNQLKSHFRGQSTVGRVLLPSFLLAQQSLWDHRFFSYHRTLVITRQMNPILIFPAVAYMALKVSAVKKNGGGRGHYSATISAQWKQRGSYTNGILKRS